MQIELYLLNSQTVVQVPSRHITLWGIIGKAAIVLNQRYFSVSSITSCSPCAHTSRVILISRYHTLCHLENSMSSEAADHSTQYSTTAHTQNALHFCRATFTPPLSHLCFSPRYFILCCHTVPLRILKSDSLLCFMTATTTTTTTTTLRGLKIYMGAALPLLWL